MRSWRAGVPALGTALDALPPPSAAVAAVAALAALAAALAALAAAAAGAAPAAEVLLAAAAVRLP